MRIWAIGTIRNEADIVRINVRHHAAQGIDRFLFIDDSSTDGTDVVLEELSRIHPLEWRRYEGDFDQSRLLTELAHEAFGRGAEWVLPIDLDEFWYAPGQTIRQVLERSDAGVLRVQVVNFVQDRLVTVPSSDALLTMTRRTACPLGTPDTIEGLVEARTAAFVEIHYPSKRISRRSPNLSIWWGNHEVQGQQGSVEDTDDIVCLHAPLRSKATLVQKLDVPRPVLQTDQYLQRAWHIRRWRRLADEGALDDEWTANSYESGRLNLYGSPRELVVDSRLADLVAPWVKADVHSAAFESARRIEGWLDSSEAQLLADAAAWTVRTFGDAAAIVEIGSYLGRSTIFIAKAVESSGMAGKVISIDPHLGQVGALDSPVGVEQHAATFERFVENINGAGVSDIVTPIRERAIDVQWHEPIGMLFIDGLHDRLSVREDLDHLSGWVAAGGLLVFHDYSPLFPGVRACADDVERSGAFHSIDIVGSLLVMQRGSRVADFAVAGRYVSFRQEQIATSIAERDGARIEAYQKEARAAAMERELRESQHALVELRAQDDSIKRENRTLLGRLALATTQLDEGLRARTDLYAELHNSQAMVRELRESWSWRLSAPLRSMYEVVLAVRSLTRRAGAVATGQEIAQRRMVGHSTHQGKAQIETAHTGDSDTERGTALLVICDAVPTPDVDSGSYRLFQMLRLLREVGYQVTFAADQDDRPKPYVVALRNLGIDIVFGLDGVEDLLSASPLKYSSVLVSRPEMGLRYSMCIAALARGATLIYDMVDFHSLRLKRGAEITGEPKQLEKAEEYKRIETYCIESADIVVAVSEEERRRLTADFPGITICVLPNIHPHVADGEPVDFWERRDLLFVGDFWHQPNVDAVRHFAFDVFPLIRESEPELEFVVVGSHVPDEVKELESQFIRIVGHVPDLSPYFRRSRIFVAPLRYGAGMKGKIGQSMSHGLPVVTTSIGAEGLELEDGVHAIVADDPSTFAGAVSRLYRDQVLWRHLASRARVHIDARFSDVAARERLQKLFGPLKEMTRH